MKKKKKELNGMTYIIVLKILASVVLIPLLLSLYLERVKSMQNSNLLQKWTYKNNLFWICLPLVILLIWAEFYSYSETTPSNNDSNLNFLPVTTYESELKNVDTNSTKNEAINQLILKFEHAEYAWNTEDFEEVIKTLKEIENGKDKRGELPILKSYVVLNNLGCAYYKKQRNKSFISSSYFNKANDVINSDDSYKEKIEENLRTLDNLVNKLD